MKVLVQWSLLHPQTWVEIDSSEWSSLPKKPIPIGGEKIDDKPGWISNVCIQGMCIGSADHVAVEHLGNSVRITLWHDDPEDYEPGKYFARVNIVHPLKPDPALGGAINTDIESIIYAGSKIFKELKSRNISDVKIRPWSEFVKPPEEITRHGIWLTNELADEHRELAIPVGWREWGKDGTVPPQRDLGRWSKAKGTITYYWRGQDTGGSGDDAYSDITPAIGQNFKLTKNSDTVNDVTRDLLQLTDSEISFAWTTESTEPNDADWPTGDYSAQIDINGLEGGNVLAEIEILQVQSDGTLIERFGTSSTYAETGLHLFTVSDKNPASGATTDRYQIRVLGTNTYQHQSRLLTLGVRTTDSYADGPWVSSVDDSSGINAKIVGNVVDSSAINAKIVGSVISLSSINAKIVGNATDTGFTNAKIVGSITDSSAINTKIVGALGSSSSCNAKIVSKDTTSNSVGAKIVGSVTSLSSINAKIKGLATTNNSINAKITGKIAASFSVNAKIMGNQDISAFIGAKIVGNQTVSNLINAKIVGNQEISGSINAKTVGIAAATSEIYAKIKGIDTTIGTINVKIIGNQYILGSVNAKVVGAKIFWEC